MRLPGSTARIWPGVKGALVMVDLTIADASFGPRAKTNLLIILATVVRTFFDVSASILTLVMK